MISLWSSSQKMAREGNEGVHLYIQEPLSKQPHPKTSAGTQKGDYGRGRVAGRGVRCQMRVARWSRIEGRYWAGAPFVRKDKAKRRCARDWSGVCGLCALTVASRPSLVGWGLGDRACMALGWRGEGEEEARRANLSTFLGSSSLLRVLSAAATPKFGLSHRRRIRFEGCVFSAR
ncbi:hypothetical protein LZ32DRAFT_23157 [Colletotrichum eremochloae]|nr:hypothetical protein LZ32DRAFT_23157 [Colletotrichum eremochloae]